MNSFLITSPSETLETGAGSELFDRWAGDAGSVIWVHIEGPLSEEDAIALERQFGLHELALADAKRDRHPPKLELFADSSFLLFKVISGESRGIDFSTVQLAVFAGPRFLVTRVSGGAPCTDQLESEIRKDPALLQEGPGTAAVRLIRLLIEDYLSLLLDLEPRLDALEDGILDPGGMDAALAELTGYKTDLKRLRRILHYHEQVLGRLRASESPGFPAELEHSINDIYEQQERANSLTLLYYELSADLVDGYLSMASHRLNGIMKILTIVTSIFVPLGFLAGVYGMNFDNMPELHSKVGYFILLGVMVFIATTLLVVFRVKRWIG